MIVPAQFRALEGKANTYELSFSSEYAVSRWFGNEILLHDDGAVDLTRLLSVGTVLFNHGRDANYGKVPIARIDKAWLDVKDKKCRAEITFDEDEDSQLIRTKVDSGSLKGVSFGYDVDSWEEVLPGKTSSNGRFTGPAYLALKWEPYEISVEPIPADPGVGVGRELELENNESEEDNMHRKFMPFHAPDGAGGGQRTNPTPAVLANIEAERHAARKAERQRVSDITSLCRSFEMDPTEFINSDATLDTVKTKILEVELERKKPTSGNNFRADDVKITTEEADKMREAASDGILLRAGVTVEKPADGSRELRGLRLRDLAIDCLVRAGKTNVHRLGDEELLREALSPDSTFASILSTSANKSMSKAYNSANTTYQLWTGRGSLTDFKPTTHYQISEAGALEKITQAGEFKTDELIDNGVSKSLATFGKKWGFTRQALINDDLSILTKVPEKYSRSARRGINKLVYSVLGNNPTIYDNTALFHANHSNIASMGSVINKDSVGAREAAMMTQKNLRGLEVLNITPKFLIIPVALKNTAKIFLKSGSDPDSLNPQIINPYQNSVEAIWDAELDGYSSTAWYLAASPNDIDTIEVDYLNGDDMPKIESRLGFDFLGIEFRIFIDYGVTVLDYRGLQKDPGASE